MMSVFPRRTKCAGDFLAAAALCITPLYAGTAPPTVTIYQGSTPTIDGVLSPGEWSDAVHIPGITGWHEECSAPNNPSDLSVTCSIKHDDTCVYFAFDVTDNVIYGIDTPRWVGSGQDSATVHSLNATGWPWYGDGIELMIDATNASTGSGPAGNGSSWKMVCSSHKSRLGGFTSGGLLEGAPSTAFTTYQNWITTGAMKAAVRIKSGSEVSGYVVEWKIRGNPCLQIANGQFWSGSSTQKTMGMNIEIEDLDERADSAGWMCFRHIGNWVLGNKELMSAWGTLVISPANNPASAAKIDQIPATGQLSVSGRCIWVRSSISYGLTLENAQGKSVCRFDGKGEANCYIPDSLPAGSYLLRGSIDAKKIKMPVVIMH
jgi:hypothetical protein